MQQAISDLDLSATSAVILDVDGTIAGADHKVTPRTRRAMAALEESGLPVVLATGRSRINVLTIAQEVGLVTPAVSCNGSVVTDPRSGEDIRVRTMADEDVEAMLGLHERTGLGFTWWTARHLFVTSEPLRDLLEAFGDAGVEIASPAAIVPGTVTKAMLYGTRAELDAVEPQVMAVAPRAMRSMDEIWELSDADASKWSGISWIFERLGVDPQHAVGLGDGGNDVVWMEQIGTPIAMGNARPEARAAARAVAGHHAQEGAAEVLEELLRQRGARVRRSA